MSTETGAARPKKRKPNSPELLDLEDLADRWGMDEESLKRFVRSEDIPFLGFRPKKEGDKEGAERVKWDRVRFRLETIRRWEEHNQDVYPAVKQPTPQPAGSSRPSLLRGGFQKR